MSQFIEMFGTTDLPKTDVKKFIDVVTSSGQYGTNTSAIDYIEGTARYIRITDINDDGSLNEDIKSAELYDDKYALAKNDIVFARTGATVGKTYLHESGDAIYAGYLIKYHPDESFIRPRFLKAFTHSSTYYNWVSKTQKVGAQPNISAVQYDNMPILVPSLAAQDEYLNIYNQADKSGFDGLKSQFIEMFDGDKYHQMELDSIAEVWLKGQAFKKDNICEEGTNFCIHYGELFTKYGPIIYDVSSTTNDEIMKASKSGDILFPASDVTPDGLARCSAIMRDEVLLGGDIIVLRPKQGNNPEYLSWAINMQKEQLLKRVTGSVVRHMSAKGLKTVQIPIAPIDKQKQFIKIVKQADKSGFELRKSIDAIDAVIKSLIN